MHELLKECFEHFSLPEIIDAYQEYYNNTGVKPTLTRRLGLYPITDHLSFDLYRQQMAAFWVPTEAKFNTDRSSYQDLTEPEKHLLSTTLGIFAFQDGDVIESLLMALVLKAPTIESKLWYVGQIAIEGIHAWSYSEQIEQITANQAEKDAIMASVDRLDILKRKQALNEKYKSGMHSYAEQQVYVACVEAISFSALFACIFSFKYKRNPSLPFLGIFWSNTKIAADEAIHRDYAIKQIRLALNAKDQLYEHLDAEAVQQIQRLSGKITTERVVEIVKEFVDVELDCVDELLPNNVVLQTISNKSLKGYVKFVADTLLEELSIPKLWNLTNPLPYMNTIGLGKQDNFFEVPVSSYSLDQDPIDRSAEDF